MIKGEMSFNYERFFDMSPDLLCIAGFDGYFKKVNPAVSKLLGYSMEELYSRKINDFVHPDDQFVTQQVRHELTMARPLYNFENRYITKSGEVVWLAWSSFPVDDDQLVFAIAKNVTHKKEMEAERSELLSRLTHVNNELKQLTYTTSHDLRSPVNNVLAVVDMIDLSTIDNEEAGNLIHILKLSGEYLKEMLDNYVDALSEKHSLLAELEQVDLQSSLEKVLRSIQSLAETSRLKLSIDFAKAPRIRFNKNYMESVFLNLLTNSIKYARPDCSPEVQIYSEETEHRVVLVFADNGQGFDMEKVRDKVFGLKQTFHHSEDSKGIGLYLVHNHVTSMGGRIELESEPNKGASFKLSFLKPLTPIEAILKK